MTKLNPDAYAYIVLQDEYRTQMTAHANYRDEERELLDRLERVIAKAMTAAERATSIMETLLKLDPPRDGHPSMTSQTSELVEL